VAVHYEIENGVLILKMAMEGFESLRSALHAALHDAGARPRMPLLIDVRDRTAGVRCEEVRWRVQVLALMRDHLGPRWAILTGTGPLRLGVARMFTVFSEAEGLEVGLFADKDAAMRWLRGQT
jgi:hypothetical protein